MYYTLQITAEPYADQPAALHKPLSIETITFFKDQVTDEEIDLVAEAFGAQIKMLLRTLLRSK